MNCTCGKCNVCLSGGNPASFGTPTYNAGIGGPAPMQMPPPVPTFEQFQQGVYNPQFAQGGAAPVGAPPLNTPLPGDGATPPITPVDEFTFLPIDTWEILFPGFPSPFEPAPLAIVEPSITPAP